MKVNTNKTPFPILTKEIFSLFSVTLFFIVGLLFSAIDLLMANTRKPAHWEQYMDWQDGVLDMDELGMILSAFLLFLGSVIRLLVNTGVLPSHTFSYAEAPVCRQFDWSHFVEFEWHDWVYLVCCVFPMLWFVFWTLAWGGHYLRFWFGIWTWGEKVLWTAVYSSWGAEWTVSQYNKDYVMQKYGKMDNYAHHKHFNSIFSLCKRG